MAGIYPKIQFEQVDWSPLGRLPAVAQEAETQRLRKSLSDLNPNTVEGLSGAGGRLLQGGDIEGGMKYLAAAQALRETQRKGEADKILREYYSKLPGINTAMPPPGTTKEEPSVDIPLIRQPAPSGATVPAPAWPSPGQRSEIPAEQQTAFNTIPSTPPSGPMVPPRGGQPTLAPRQIDDPLMPKPMIPLQPGERIGEQNPEEAAPYRVAGPPMPPPSTALPPVTVTPGERPVPPPGPAVPGTPAWLEGAKLRPAVIPTTPTINYGPPGKDAEAEAARREAADVGSRLASRPPRPRGAPEDPVEQALMAQFRNALGRLKVSQSDKDWQEARIQRLREGQSDISKDDWELDKKIGPERYKEAEKVYLDYENKAKGSSELLSTLDRMDQIRKDPNFVSGEAAPYHAKFMSWMSSLAQIAGIKVPNLGGIREKINALADPHMKAAALNAEFTSLANNALMAHVGNLSKAFSDADRQFVEKIFPSILQTPGGIERVMGNLRAMSEYSVNVGRQAREYMKDKQMRSTPYGVHDAVQKYKDENPLFVDSKGNPTPLAQQIMGSGAQPPLIGATPGATPNEPPAPPPGAVPPARASAAEDIALAGGGPAQAATARPFLRPSMPSPETPVGQVGRYLQGLVTPPGIPPRRLHVNRPRGLEDLP